MAGDQALTRNPFIAEYDRTLHCFGGMMAAKLERARDILASGADLWVSGPPGSGRESLLRVLVEERLGECLPAVSLTGIDRVADVLSILGRNLPCREGGQDRLAVAERVYAALLEGFWTGRPFIAIADAGFEGGEWEELGVLSGLSFMGERLVMIGGCGLGEPPLPSMELLSLEAPRAGEIADMLRQRVALCGAAGLLDEEVDAIAADAHGYSDALKSAQAALNARLFRREREKKIAGRTESAAPIFESGSFAEVGRLLDAISGKTPL